MLNAIEFFGNMCLLALGAFLAFYAIKVTIVVIQCLIDTLRSPSK